MFLKMVYSKEDHLRYLMMNIIIQKNQKLLNHVDLTSPESICLDFSKKKMLILFFYVNLHASYLLCFYFFFLLTRAFNFLFRCCYLTFRSIVLFFLIFDKLLNVKICICCVCAFSFWRDCGILIPLCFVNICY